MEEIWKYISGYDGLYQISNLGNLKLKSGKIANIISTGRDGYKCTVLTKKHLQRDNYKVVKNNAKERKITDDIVLAIRKDYQLGMINKDIAEKYCISKGSSSQIINYKRYKDV